MLNENLKAIRKSKGLSQEELAIRLNVVRQTVSKWEKGLSVPDADMIIKIGETFEVPVSQILGAAPEGTDSTDSTNTVEEQLSRINEQLAIKNRRWGCVIKAIIGVIIAFVVVNMLLILLNFAAFSVFRTNETVAVLTNQSQAQETAKE
ncbi:MAG: helix-turn-helix transcriptional regulator [Oscillospiraceae bacterium]